MVPALLGAGRVHRPLSSAAPRDDAPGPGLQVRRRASADLGPVHRQVDRRREQEHGGARRGREAAEGEGARRGRGQAAPHPRGQREDQESLNLNPLIVRVLIRGLPAPTVPWMAQGATAKQRSREELALSWFLAALAAGYGWRLLE